MHENLVRYYGISNIITDDITLTDGTKCTGYLGGALTYAAAGMRLWSDRIGVVSGVGKDFEDLHGNWFDSNGIDRAGLFIADENTPRSWITYFDDGERQEIPQFGIEHFIKMLPYPKHIPDGYAGARGVYVFRHDEIDFWDGLLQLKREQDIKIIWEITPNVIDPACWTRISKLLEKINLFSINQTEASSLCGTDRGREILDRILDAGVQAAALRQGGDGALVADYTGCYRIPVVPSVPVDVTGCGNAFTGAFLVGYCESGGDLVRAGLYGAVAASFALEQYGPPEHIDRKMQKLAAGRLKSIEGKIIKLKNGE